MLSTWVKCADCRRRCPAAQGRTAAGLRASHAPMEAVQAASSGPRRRESPTRSQPTLLDLPDALLSRIIAPLSQDDKCVLAGGVDVGLALPAASRRTHQRPAAIDSALCPGDHRFQHVALVCHRLRDVCLAPELLHHVIMYSSSSSPGPPAPPDPVPRLQALLSWLRRAGDGGRSHGSHVQRLDICIHSQSEEVAALVTQCLETCCMSGGSLQQLKVDRWTPVADASCVARMTRLTALTLGCFEQPVQLPAGLSQLTALKVAALSGGPLMLEGPCLPTSLTSLFLYDPSSTAMPTQVSYRGHTSLHSSCSHSGIDGMLPCVESLPDAVTVHPCHACLSETKQALAQLHLIVFAPQPSPMRSCPCYRGWCSWT